jgi:tetratricopeptide (TPR) repeat protein
LSILEQAHAGDHPDVATALTNLGRVLARSGLRAEAVATWERALLMRQRLWGEGHPRLAPMHDDLADTLDALARYDEAAAQRRRALELREGALGPEHPAVAGDLERLAVSLVERGDTEEPLALLQRAVEIRQQTAPQDAEVAGTLDLLARVQIARGLRGPAEDLVAQALAIRMRALGSDDAATAVTAAELGRLRLESRRFTAAVGALQQALSIDERNPLGDPVRRAAWRFQLALALWGARKRPQALAMATRARDELAALPGHAEVVAEIDAWRGAPALTFPLPRWARR